MTRAMHWHCRMGNLVSICLLSLTFAMVCFPASVPVTAMWPSNVPNLCHPPMHASMPRHRRWGSRLLRTIITHHIEARSEAAAQHCLAAGSRLSTMRVFGCCTRSRTGRRRHSAAVRVRRGTSVKRRKMGEKYAQVVTQGLNSIDFMRMFSRIFPSFVTCLNFWFPN